MRGVIAASMRAGSMCRVVGSMSTNTGRAPTLSTALAVAAHASGVVMTSWPSSMPSIRSATSIVTAPELNTRTVRPRNSSDSAASNSAATRPVASQPERSTSATPRMVCSSISGRVSGRNGSSLIGSTARSGVGAARALIGCTATP